MFSRDRPPACSRVGFSPRANPTLHAFFFLFFFYVNTVALSPRCKRMLDYTYLRTHLPIYPPTYLRANEGMRWNVLRERERESHSCVSRHRGENERTTRGRPSHPHNDDAGGRRGRGDEAEANNRVTSEIRARDRHPPHLTYFRKLQYFRVDTLQASSDRSSTVFVTVDLPILRSLSHTHTQTHTYNRQQRLTIRDRECTRNVRRKTVRRSRAIRTGRDSG